MCRRTCPSKSKPLAAEDAEESKSEYQPPMNAD